MAEDLGPEVCIYVQICVGKRCEEESVSIQATGGERVALSNAEGMCRDFARRIVERLQRSKRPPSSIDKR
jgi:hypothetical protein